MTVFQDNSGKTVPESPSRSEGLQKEPNISIFLFFRPSLDGVNSDVLFTGGRGVSDFSVLKYY